MNGFNLAASFANAAWGLSNTPAYFSFLHALQNPGDTQEKLLMRYIRQNRDTAFGRAHGFGDLHSSDDFARRVPLADYEDLQPWVDRIAGGEQNMLTAEPVTRLLPTSGSTRACKWIPYTAGLQGEFNNAIAPWICDLFRAQPDLMYGSAYWSITPAIQSAESFNTESFNAELPVGFDEDSAYLGGVRKRLVHAVMATPPWLGQVQSIDAFRYLTLLLLLRRRDLRLISVWHPSFLMQLMQAMKSNWNALLQDIDRGGCAVASSIPASARQDAMAGFLAWPDRARELAGHGAAFPSRLWPCLKLISCWADAHAVAAGEELASLFSTVALQPKGLLATEGVVTIPFAGQTPVALRSHFFEFIEVSGMVRKLADLVIGSEYEVVMTTAGGLWRYRLRDRVRVTGRLDNTPCLQFVGKLGLISDRFGEKLSEAFVAQSLQTLFKKNAIQPAFAMLAPDLRGSVCRYTLYIEPPLMAGLSEKLDAELSSNPNYAYCRKLGQLAEPGIFVLSDRGFDAYASHLMKAGIKLGDIKPSSLSVIDRWSSLFTGRYAS